jgi:hypothetical protein
VLPIGLEGHDFSAALKGMPESDQYELSLDPLDDGAPLRASCSWHDSHARLTTTLHLSPGLYFLQVYDSGAPLGSRVAVLLVGPEKFQTTNEAFGRAKEAAERWRGSARAESIHYFLTVALDSLSTAMPGQRDDN